MREDFGVLALGQCGSNIAVHFECVGYTTVYVNSSIEDLSTVRGTHKIHIPNAEGAAKDRQRILQIAKDSIVDIVEKITSILTQKYYIVCFSGGGGTGSGLSTPLLRYLTQIGKIVIPVVVLPNEAIESAKTCENAYNCCVELMSIKGLGATFLLDNSKHDKFEINNRFVKDLDAFINIKNASVYGNMDIAEKKQVLSCPGVAVIATSSKAKSNAPEIIQKLHGGIYAKITSKTAYYLAISTSNRSFSIDSLTKEIGTVYDIFSGVSESTSVVCVSGLQWPQEKLMEFKNKFEQVVNNINANNFIQEPLKLEPLQGLSFSQPSTQLNNPTNPRDILMNLLNI